MKNFLVILLAISVITTIAGCTFRQSKVNDVTSENPATLASTPKSSDASMPEESKTDDVMESSKVNRQIVPPTGSRKCELSVPDGDKITMYLPEEWSTEGNAIIGDYTLAEVHSFDTIDDIDSFYKQLGEKYIDAEVIGDFASNELEGKYYWLETEAESGGMTIKQNELVYFIHFNDKVLSISFYPAVGVGISTQRENFELYLATVNI